MSPMHVGSWYLVGVELPRSFMILISKYPNTFTYSKKKKKNPILNIFKNNQSNSLYYDFFLKEFQPMASTPDNNSLSLDQDTDQFLV